MNGKPGSIDELVDYLTRRPFVDFTGHNASGSIPVERVRFLRRTKRGLWFVRTGQGDLWVALERAATEITLDDRGFTFASEGVTHRFEYRE